MRFARLLPERLRRLAPEAFAFAVIGALNSVLYFVIFNATMRIGAVKATVIATVITTTLSYLANRHWTYRHRPRTALRREYVLFFGFNFAGMLIQSSAVGIGKYGFGLSEEKHRLAFNALTLVGIGLATVFRFWAYRTFVFLKPVADEPLDRETLAEMDPVAELAEAVVDADTAPAGATPHPRTGTDADLDAELAAEVDAARRPAGR